MYIETNKYQTPITDELLAEYPEEIQEWFYDFVTNVPFIKNLISPDRKYARDLPRDEKGRIIVDITNPHIIEDADYFRQPALHFMKHQCYTFLKPNSNPHSEYRRFWDEELRRCRDGYVRPSDGEWVTGFCYWFLNYCPMMVNMITEGRKKAIRTESFPFFFEGIYLRFHYLWQARESGKHAIELAKRGCAKSYSLASIMSHNLILGENAESCRRVITVLTAYEKEYLKDDKDGTLSKFKPAINFQFTNTPFPHLLLKNSPNEMTWQMGYKDELGIERGSLNQVLGVSAKDNPDKLRGKRGWILFEEMGSFKGLLALYDTTRKSVEDGDYTFATMYLVGCVCAGTKVWTLNGRNINIEDLKQDDGIIGFTDSFMTNTMPNIILSRGITKEPIINPINIAKKECVYIKLSNGNSLKCSIDHPILIQKLRMNHDGSKKYYEEVFKNAGELKIGDRVIESREIPIFGTDNLFDARLIGMLIGDGSYGLRQSPKYSSEDKELLDYIKNKYNWSLSNKHITKKGKQYEDIRIKGICSNLKDIGIYGQVKTNKRLPINYQTLTKEDTSLLLSGLYDTDGSIWFNKDGFIALTQSNKEILEQVQLLWRKFGIISTIIEAKPKIMSNRKDKNPWFNLIISGRYNCLRAYNVLSLLVPHKKDKLDFIKNYYDNHYSKKEQKYPKDILVYKVTSIENIGEQDVYNLTAGLSHTYLANNIVTHNTAAEKESDFSSAKTLLYSPDGYNILALPNVYDKQKQGKAEFGFFYPSYVNRAGCYNKDGVSDVVKALLQILTARYKAKYSADPKSVLRVIAEDPVTPQEAIIKVKNAYFPIQQIEERIAQIDQNPRFYDDTYVGFMVQNQNGEAEFKNTADIPIRDFPTADNKEHGAVEIFVMPERDSRGKKFENRYIAGIDPIDNDSSETMSLFSIHILDLFTDQLVAEYTGRLDFVDDCYEQARLLLMFYNAVANYENNLKGLYSYFRKMNCTHLLCDTPEYLKDKQLIKVTSTGNNIKGVRATAPINNYANGLLRDWLLKPVTIISKNEEGQEIEMTIPNLFLIKNRAILKELALFTPEMNVDRIRALGMLMLYREEKMILYQGDMSKANQEKVDSDYLGNDDYFSRNFNINQRQFSKFSKFNALG